MINMGEIFEYDRIKTPPMNLVPLTEKEKEVAMIQKNDLLFARQSLTLEGAGKCSIVLEDKPPRTYESHLIRVRLDPKKAYAPFYYYYFQSYKGRSTIKSIVEQVAAAGIRGSDLKKIDVPSPPLEEQKNRVSLLESIDEKIDLNNRIISNFEELAQTLFKRWFIDFDFPNEDGAPYRLSDGKMVESNFGFIPEGWMAKSLDEIGHYQNGLAMQKYPPDSESDSLPVIKIRELNKGTVDANSNRCSTNIKESTRVYDGDIIFSWSGTLLVKAWTGGNAGLNQHLFKITSDYYPKWLYYYWTLHHLRQFTSIAQDKATTMGHIKRSHLKEAKIAIPASNEELEYFNSKMSPLLEKIIEAGIEIRKLKSLRDTVLPKLLSGEIEINEKVKEEVNALLQ